MVGILIADRYEILEKIGTGGMSDVYKALDRSLGREVAIKILKEEFLTDMGFVTKFRAEAMAAAGLEHPNIVNVYDVGSHEGRHFIVMEYVEGVTLKTYIAKKGRLSYNELLSIAIQAGRGIEAAHNKSIIHRDIKPQNIMISKEGKVKVTDFGIARAVTGNTINADRMGSVHYSSPEQARNGYVTFQSDVYSLGIVMYEMCTGRVPFDGDTTVAIAIQHLQSEMVPPSRLVSDVPISVEKIILKATMKNPERRYGTMSEMLADLKTALSEPHSDFVVIAPPGGVAEQPSEAGDKEEIKPKKTSEKSSDVVPVVRKKKPRVEEDDDDDDEDGVSSGIDKAVTFMGIATAIVIIIIVAYLIVNFMGGLNIGSQQGNKPPENITENEDGGKEPEDNKNLIPVPDVLGKSEQEAKVLIEEKGFVYKKIGEASSDKYEAGRVMDQSITPNEPAKKGSTIEIMVSSGSGNLDIPSVENLTQEQAIKSIEAKGFICNPQMEFSADIEQGRVIRQSPDSTQKGNRGDTITIWVSRGPEVVPVTNVVGMSEEEATKVLTDAGFTVLVETETSETVPEGSVCRQNPRGQAEKGAEITIYVSEGPSVTLYSFARTFYPIDGSTVYVVIKDSEGNLITRQEISDFNGIEIRIQNLSVPAGVIYYYFDEAHTFEAASAEAVEFTLQQ